MKAKLKLLILLFCGAVVAGCGSGEQKSADTPAPEPKETPAPAVVAEEPDDEMDSDGHHDPVNLGTQTIGAYTVEVIAYGGIEPGHDGDIDVDIDGGTPKAVRAWVGLEDAIGTPKSLAEAEGGGHYHVHVDVGDELPNGAQFWLELEEENGDVIVVAFEI